MTTVGKTPTALVLHEQIAHWQGQVDRLKAAAEAAPDQATAFFQFQERAQFKAYQTTLHALEARLRAAERALAQGDLQAAHQVLREIAPAVHRTHGLWNSYYANMGHADRIEPRPPPHHRISMLRAAEPLASGTPAREFGAFLLDASGEWGGARAQQWSQVVDSVRGARSVTEAMQRLYAGGYFQYYRSEPPSMAGLLDRRGGNCVAQTKLIVAALRDADVPLNGWTLGVQLFADHLQAVLVKRQGGKSLVRSVLTNEQVKTVVAPIYRPELFHHAYATGRGIAVASADTLKLYDGPRPAAGETVPSAAEEAAVDPADPFVFPAGITARYSLDAPPAVAHLGLAYPEPTVSNGAPFWRAGFASPLPIDVPQKTLEGRSIRAAAQDGTWSRGNIAALADALWPLGFDAVDSLPVWRKVFDGIGHTYRDSPEAYDGYPSDFRDAVVRSGAEALPLLRTIIRTPDGHEGEARALALELLGRIGPPAAAAVDDLLRLPQWDVDEIDALRSMAPTDARLLPRLLHIVHETPVRRSEHGELRLATVVVSAVQSLGAMGSRAKPAIAKLSEYARSERLWHQDRADATEALLQIAPSVALQFLSECLAEAGPSASKRELQNDLLWRVRTHAEKFPQLRRLASAIRELATSSDFWIAMNAKEALQKLQPEERRR
ncbi:MAG: hypothetical protein HY696_00275 [Deltaproteobacteria bacterium]|nr:hypothetical protein [Deltaproteobacteria bacterium]